MQTDALRRAGCEKIWVESELSGTKPPTERPELADLWRHSFARETCWWSIGSTGSREMRAPALEVIEDMEARGLALRSLDGVTTEGPMGKLVLTIMAAVAEMEVGILRERTKDRLRAARERGQTLG